MSFVDVRCFSYLDRLIIKLDMFLDVTIVRDPEEFIERCDYPMAESSITEAESRYSGALMRVNHSGEVSAQGLYLGQAVFAKDQDTASFMVSAAADERKHLAWCARRLRELNSDQSLFTAVWFYGSFVIGGLASLAGDRRNLGFVEETEKQVSRHLDGHLSRIPLHDQITRQILEQMRQDEIEHGVLAKRLGAVDPPQLVKRIMGFGALIMKEVSYRF